MKVFALTGSIAAGKSTVAELFSKLGVVIINADKIAHETYAPGTSLYEEILERYGQHLMTTGGEIDRKILASILFQDPQEKKWLEAKIHPLTRDKISKHLQKLQKQPKKPALVLVEAALHVESNYYKEFGGLIVVHTDPKIQLKRLMRRDSLSLAEAQARLASQISSTEKKKYADWVIENSASLEETQKQVEKLFQELTK